jgi:N-acetylmuramoyl-L-alanine amidase
MASALGLAAPPPSARLATIINGQPVEGEGRAVIINGVILLPLHVLAERLNWAVGWLEDTRTVRIEAYGRVIYLPLDTRVALVDGKSLKLLEPAQAFAGRSFVPVRFLAGALDFDLRYSAAPRRVEIRAPEYALTEFRYALVDGRPQIILAGSRPLVAQAAWQQNPLRLVLDFPLARLAKPAGMLPTGDPLVKEVTWRQERRDLVRVTIALGREMPYDFAATGDQLAVVFPPQVRAAELVSDGRRRLVAIRSTAALKPTVHRLSDPDRLVIDLPGAALAGPSRVALNDEWVRAIRLGQLDRQTVRVVADLEGPLGWAEEPPTTTGTAPEGEAVWALHLLNRVTGVAYHTLKDRTQLRFTLAVGAAPTVVVDRQAGRLELDLSQASGEGLAPEIQVDDGTVERLRLLDGGPGTVRWAIDLPYYVGHRLLPGRVGEAVVEISRSPVYRKLIFLDPGHGGADPGAIGLNGLLEKEVNLALALRLRDFLIEAGAEVVLSRESDVFVPLYERAHAANSREAAAFVSLHANASPKTWEFGTETYYHPDRPGSRDLADEVQRTLVETLQRHDRGKRPTKEFVVTRETTMPAILVELAFLSNPAEEQLLGDPLFREQAAGAITSGILAYFRRQADPWGPGPQSAAGT